VVFIIYIYLLDKIYTYLLFLLLRVAFITLLERKILSYSQNRLGPQKVLFIGYLQPVIDGLKLIFKNFLLLKETNNKLFFATPVLIFVILIIIYSTIPIYFTNFKFSILFYMVCIGLSVYFIIVQGWSSNSKFPFLGRIRSISQSISFEVRLRILIFSVLFFLKRLNFFFFINNLRILFFFSPIFFLIFISLCAEINRAPFDFSEGESELVSGFNTEYSRFGFILIFLSEYGFIIFYILFLSIFLNSIFLFFPLLFFILLLRRVFPRFRYDKLIYFN